MNFIVDRKKLIEIMAATHNGKCRYVYGAKPSLRLKPYEVNASDCSGYVRYILSHVATPQIKLPLGSWYQEAWCKKNLKQCSYLDAEKSDSILRIAFISAKNGTPGHVWLIASGRTIECYGGYGAGRRSWKTLANRNPRCYIVGKMIP